MDLKYFLIDLDGVLYNGGVAVEGAAHALQALRENGCKFQLVSNTSGKTTDAIKEKLNSMGFEVYERDIFLAAEAMVRFIKHKKSKAKCYLIGTLALEEAMKDAGLNVTRKEEPVDFVVVAHDNETTYNKMDIALRLLLKGAGFVGVHDLRFYPNETGVHITSGAFIKALEYSSGKPACIIGKPNPDFFKDAMRKMKAKREQTAMVGDDIFADIKGAQECGLKAIFVESGSYSRDDLARNNIKPDAILKSIKDLPAILG
ncbi:MAG: HAD-IIA family hydrolase [Candidatus Aenigmarchaeota archaeon]|nr:HAD-IIA family hydrolase [Candidatus Aenigmarchaeota archaeon]